jgi:hypothetical protein
MTDDGHNTNQPTPASADRPKGLLDAHPKLGIILIAAGFYALLFGMCGFVLVIIFTGRI